MKSFSRPVYVFSLPSALHHKISVLRFVFPRPFSRLVAPAINWSAGKDASGAGKMSTQQDLQPPGEEDYMSKKRRESKPERKEEETIPKQDICSHNPFAKKTSYNVQIFSLRCVSWALGERERASPSICGSPCTYG